MPFLRAEARSRAGEEAGMSASLPSQSSRGFCLRRSFRSSAALMIEEEEQVKLFVPAVLNMKASALTPLPAAPSLPSVSRAR